jgi:hypothetical protein
MLVKQYNPPSPNLPSFVAVIPTYSNHQQSIIPSEMGPKNKGQRSGIIVQYKKHTEHYDQHESTIISSG